MKYASHKKATTDNILVEKKGSSQTSFLQFYFIYHWMSFIRNVWLKKGRFVADFFFLEKDLAKKWRFLGHSLNVPWGFETRSLICFCDFNKWRAILDGKVDWPLYQRIEVWLRIERLKTSSILNKFQRAIFHLFRYQFAPPPSSIIKTI